MTDQEMLQQVQERIAKEQQGQPSNDGPKLDKHGLPIPKPDFVERCLYANELGDGLLFAYLFKGRHAYVGQADEWIWWSGHHWSVDLIEKGHRARADVEHVAQAYYTTGAHFDRLAKDAERDGDKESAGRLKAKAEKMKARAARLRTETGRKRCLEFAKTNLESPLAIAGDEIDRDPWSLPMANGVVDLRTGEIRPGRPDDWLVKSSPVEWQGIDAPCPHWEHFVTEIMGDDPEMAAFLQRVFGYGVTGLAREHIFLVLFGRGRNGKGIMTEVIQTVLGGQNATTALAGPVQSEMLLDQGKNRSAAGPSPDIMSLRGLRIAFASETDEGQRFSPARVKWFSGGETLTGRYPHDKRNVSFAPTHLLALLTNHKPHAPASDFAFWERLLLVDFPLSFVDRKPQNENERPMDKGLKDRLLQELPGIAAWLVRGCLEWQRVGIAPPAKVREATSEYRRDEDLLADFVDECCDLQQEGQPEIRSKASDLYDAFCAWFKRNVSAKKSISQKAFGKMMLERFQRERKGGTYYYFGVSVSPHAQLELDQEE